MARRRRGRKKAYTESTDQGPQALAARAQPMGVLPDGRLRGQGLRLPYLKSFLPASLVFTVLTYVSLHPPVWILLLIPAIATLLALALPKLVESSRRRFEKDLHRLMASGQRDKLLELYNGQRLLRLLGPRRYLKERLGWILTEAERPIEAAMVYKELADSEEGKHNPALLVNLGNAWLKADELDAAAQALKQALALAPQLPRAVAAMAVVEARQGNAKAGLDRLQTIMGASGTMDEEPFLLARAEIKLLAGDAQGALADLEATATQAGSWPRADREAWQALRRRAEGVIEGEA